MPHWFDHFSFYWEFVYLYSIRDIQDYIERNVLISKHNSFKYIISIFCICSQYLSILLWSFSWYFGYLKQLSDLMLLYLFPIMTDDYQFLLKKIQEYICLLVVLYKYSHGYDWMYNFGIDLQPYSIRPQDWLHLRDIELCDIKQISIEYT